MTQPAAATVTDPRTRVPDPAGPPPACQVCGAARAPEDPILDCGWAP